MRRSVPTNLGQQRQRCLSFTTTNSQIGEGGAQQALLPFPAADLQSEASAVPAAVVVDRAADHLPNLREDGFTTRIERNSAGPRPSHRVDRAGLINEGGEVSCLTVIHPQSVARIATHHVWESYPASGTHWGVSGTQVGVKAPHRYAAFGHLHPNAPIEGHRVSGGRRSFKWGGRPKGLTSAARPARFRTTLIPATPGNPAGAGGRGSTTIGARDTEMPPRYLLYFIPGYALAQATLSFLGSLA